VLLCVSEFVLADVRLGAANGPASEAEKGSVKEKTVASAGAVFYLPSSPLEPAALDVAVERDETALDVENSSGSGG